MIALVYMPVGSDDVDRLAIAASSRDQDYGRLWRVWHGRRMLAIVAGHDPAAVVLGLLGGRVSAESDTVVFFEAIE